MESGACPFNKNGVLKDVQNPLAELCIPWSNQAKIETCSYEIRLRRKN